MTISMLTWYRFFDKCVLRGFIEKMGILSINALQTHLSKKQYQVNIDVSKGGDDILKIVGGVVFYVERFYEKLKKKSCFGHKSVNFGPILNFLVP